MALRTSMTLSSMAVLATGLAVGGGALSLSADGGADGSTDGDALVATLNGAVPSARTEAEAAGGATTGAKTGADDTAGASALTAGRGQDVSRSDRRERADLKQDALSLGTGNAMTRTEDLSGEDPRLIAQALLSEFGFSQDQFGCLDSLWTRESNWSVGADNPSSSAYGIPQALPGSKMSSAGSDWATNPVTQIRWGLGYIADRYGSPCGAWAHSQSSGFY